MEPTSPRTDPTPINGADPIEAPAHATVVLVVDDEPALRRLIAFTLRREGYFVVEAKNGLEAIDVADRIERVDLMVSDVVMPLMKGPETAAKLRSRFPNAQVLFVSGYLDNEDLGPNAHSMQKPFLGKELVNYVAQIVGPPGSADAAS